MNNCIKGYIVAQVNNGFTGEWQLIGLHRLYGYCS